MRNHPFLKALLDQVVCGLEAGLVLRWQIFWQRPAQRHDLRPSRRGLNPRLVIFGGALFGAAPELVSDPLKRLIRQRSLEKSADDAELRVSPLGAESGALGASRMIAGQALESLYTHSLGH